MAKKGRYTAKGKLTECKSCGERIAVSAKTCPHCGAKNKKPFYKKAWFWILIVLALILSSGSGEEESFKAEPNHSNSNTNPPVAAQKEEIKEIKKSEYHVGDSVHSGNLKIVYMSSGDYISSNEYIQPTNGNKFIFLKFAFENTSAASDASASIYNFECYADGYNAEMQYFDEEILSATLSAGRAVSGYLYFEVPENAQTIEIEYTENLFTEDKIKFIYEGNVDSGYILEGNATASENVFQIGEAAESKQLRITYLSCFEDDSNNQFIVPKDGYHFVTCEFEFENLSDSDQSISFYSFDCYADGLNCEGSYFRNDALSATLSAGRKAKGTVTFEVPYTASVVEVEYLSNFWTSNRVIFNALIP